MELFESRATFLICSFKPPVAETFGKLELLERLKFTASESEAWDIVQMEEIERELLDGGDINFEANPGH